MGHRLLICEKPSQARNVADVLGVTGKGKGYIETKDGTVTHGIGHLIEEQVPDEYGQGWDKWDLGVLPMVPSPWRMKVKEQVQGQFHVVRGLLKNATEVVIASDPDREGEAIVRNILEECGWRPGPGRKLFRLWFNGEDKASIKKALERIRAAEETEAMFWAQRARARGDWLFGMNLTRLLSKVFDSKGSLNAGRVLLPTLRMVVDRDRLIENFKPEAYFELTATVGSPDGGVKAKHRFPMRHTRPEDRQIKAKEEAAALARQALHARNPLQVTREKKRQGPPNPFTLPALQKRTNNLWGWSADRTLEVAQQLYDARLTTYPRSECAYLADDQAHEIGPTLAHLGGQEELRDLVAGFQPQVRKSVFNSAKVTNHSALIPTMERAPLDRLEADERKLYLLIARGYIAALMPDYEYEATRIELVANGVPFAASGQVPLVLGWRAAFMTDAAAEKSNRKVEDGEEGDDEERTLPPVQDGDMACVEDVQVDARQTRPPARYTEATLLGDMESIGKYVQDERYKKILKETSGIGTAATRHEVLKKLKDEKVGYLKVEKRKIISTEKGRALIDALLRHLPQTVDLGVTAIWEMALEGIAGADPEQSRAASDRFIERIAGDVGKHCEIMKGLPAVARAAFPALSTGRDTGGRERPRLEGDGEPCPSCGAQRGGVQKTFVSKKTGNPFLGCSRWQEGCAFRKFPEGLFDGGRKLEVKGEGCPCPKCGKGTLRARRSAKGTVFLGCSTWQPGGAGCDHVQWLDDGPRIGAVKGSAAKSGTARPAAGRAGAGPRSAAPAGSRRATAPARRAG
jgi:DNA topoisomerase-3